MSRMGALKSICTTAVLSAAAVAGAEDRVVSIWDCQLNEGKTLEDVHAANDKWVALTEKAGGDIRSFVAQPAVGADMTGFKYLDSYPSLKSWADIEEVMASDEGQAIGAELDAVATCESSTLYRAEESG